MSVLTLRTKSAGPRRRGGFDLGPLGQWALHVLESAAVEGLQRLLDLVLDPKVEVEIGTPKGDNDFHWEPAPPAEDIKARIAEVAGPVQTGLIEIPADIEAQMRRVFEAQLQAVREGRWAMPSLKVLDDTLTWIAAAEYPASDPDQAELDLTGASIGELVKGQTFDDFLPADAGDTDTTPKQEPAAESDGQRGPEKTPAPSVGDTPILSQPGEAEGQVQEVVVVPPPAPEPALAPAPTKTAAKPEKAKRHT